MDSDEEMMYERGESELTATKLQMQHTTASEATRSSPKLAKKVISITSVEFHVQ